MPEQRRSRASWSRPSVSLVLGPGTPARAPTRSRLDTRHYGAETGLYPALQRQAARLGFADLLSAGDEPEQILERFPAVTARPRVDGTPEMRVRHLRNAR